MKREISIYSALAGIEEINPPNTTCVVIDVLRASTTILCLMEGGLECVQIVSTVEEALALKKPDTMLIGERGEEPLQNFEFDNSPYQVSKQNWLNKRAILTTTNGTRAIAAVQTCKQVVIAGFRNIDAVARSIQKNEHFVAITPIGNKGDPRLEDELCADALKKRILGLPVNWEEIVKPIWEERNLKLYSRGETYKKDVALALTINATSIIPLLENGLILRKTV
jgi:2-phosphosulfolactate phosphatase